MADRMDRSGRRAFRPGDELGGGSGLESRDLLSIFRVIHIPLKPYVQTFTQFGGQIAKVLDTKGNVFNVDLVGGGHVRATAMSGGRVKLIVEGTNPGSELSINSVHPRIVEGLAHQFQGTPTADPVLHIGAIVIKSGAIGSILGYRTADLSGPLVVSGTAPVDRIALLAVTPGGSIVTGGDVDTLDLFNDLSVSGGPGVNIGRDINFLNVGGNIVVGPGSSFTVGRDIGVTFQQIKGTDPGGQGGIINGNLEVQPGGSFVLGRDFSGPFIINGNTTGASRISFVAGAQFFFSRGGVTA